MIFFVNVPVGVVGLVLAARLVPALETRAHTFDWVGVALSAVGLFCGIFAIQEGETYHWGTIRGFVSVPLLLAVGAVMLVAFVWWQSRMRTEPLVPLGLFRDRNFSVSNVAITSMGFAITAAMFPMMLWAQAVRGYDPTHAALLLAPQAVMSIVLARPVGGLVDKVHPRVLASTGLLAFSLVLVGFWTLMTPTSPVWAILLLAVGMGASGSLIWGPLAASANRNLPPHLAGAGSGVYNTTRQVGAVLGSAAITALMQNRLAAHLPGFGGGATPGQSSGGALPPMVRDGFSKALAESMLLPAAVLLVGFAATLLFEQARHLQSSPGAADAAAATAETPA